jgi:3-isopropylmalate/(R)-2-methylmalate dehydratase large subunit
MTLLDQILAQKGLQSQGCDTSLLVPVDHIYAHDRNTFKILEELEQHARVPLSSALALNKLRLFLDHYAPPPSLETAALHRQQRSLADQYSLFLSDVGSGVGHQVAVERLIGSAEVAVGIDSHTCTAGALGALAFRQPPPEVARAVKDGVVRFDVPVVVRIELIGRLQDNCTAKDIFFHLASSHSEQFEDALLEIGGDGLGPLTMSERFTLANLSSDLHARTAIIETDEITKRYLTQQRRPEAYLQLRSEPAAYSSVVEVVLENVKPMVASPPHLFTAVPVEDSPGFKIDVIALGSCTNGRYEDFVDFLDFLGNQKIADSVRLLVTPGSKQVLIDLVQNGLLSKLIEAGATVNPPGCGPCMGLHQGLLQGDEICLATGSQNMPGRMGSKAAKVFLAGPKVAGASAIRGCLTTPKRPS